MNNKKRLYWIIGAIAAVLLCIVLVVVIVNVTKKDDKNPVGPDGATAGEVGVYYYDDTEKDEEYQIALEAGNKFSFAVKGTLKIGNYTLTGEALTFTSEKNDWTQNATLKNDVITVTYEGAEMRFLKKKDCTVSFDSAGGSPVASVTVLNGKTLAKPDDPAREGYIFLGWYSDAELKQPFAFGAEAITMDRTLYARWALIGENTNEYKISYDLGYEGAINPESSYTQSGKLFAPAADPARDGFTFKGWWISMENDATRLSYRYVMPDDKGAGTVFDADTTLFAVWQAAGVQESPMVSVKQGAIEWDTVGAAAYLVTVTAPDGSKVMGDQRTTGTTVPITFDMTGVYKIEVKAVDATGKAIADVTERYYVNNGLTRVSGIMVAEPSTLIYRGVANAQKYLITIQCGNKLHNHTSFDNGTSLYYNFLNCDMQEGGITFIVTAVADGYAESKATFVYERRLDSVTGLKAENDMLTWNAVEGATGYRVTAGGKQTFDVSTNEFSLKFVDACTQTYSVTPVAKGYNSPVPAYITYAKTTLAAPADVRVNGTVVTWNAVKDATSYEVKLNDKTFAIANGATSFDLAAYTEWVEAADYTLSVKAIGGAGSAESDVVAVRYHAMYPTLSYAGSILSWRPVVGAVSYDVQMNDGEIVTVNTNTYEVKNFEKAGDNVLKVRYTDGSYTSEWITITVRAYTITLDSRGGSPVEALTLYKAVGDKLELPTTTKAGYDFSAWYNVPGGPDSNGAAFTDTVFVQSSEIVLYAYYTPKAYNVRYNYQISVSNTEETGVIYYNRPYQLVVPTAANQTSIFGGWYSAPYGRGTRYTDANGKSLAPWSSMDENVTVYAFWIDAVLKYDLVGNGYLVSGGDRIGMVSELTIPAQYNGVNVTEIAGSAFANCTNLKVINIPNTVTRIAAETAFSGCTNLTEINIYSVDGNANIRYTSVDGVLFDNGDLASRHAPQPVAMPMGKTGSYRIPDSVEVIPYSAFRGSSLSKVIIPISVKEIANEAFAGCASLTTVTFEQPGIGVGSKPLTIGDRAFMNCTAMTEIMLPARLSSISLARYTINGNNISTSLVADAFNGCKSLAAVNVFEVKNSIYRSVDGVLLSENGRTLAYFPAGKTLAGAAREDTAVSYTFPEGVTKIGNGAFFGCDGLTGVLEIPGRITSIGECAFYDCGYLEGTLTFKTGGVANVSIGAWAFAESRISEIVYEPATRVNEIGKGAFYKCDYLEDQTITIPASMEKIGDLAFAEIGDITIEFAGGTKTLELGNEIFSGCSIGTLTLPANAKASSGFLGGATLEAVKVAEGNSSFADDNGVLYSKGANGEAEVLLYYPSGRTETEYTVPATVTTIGDSVFAGNTNLKTVTLPASVTLIGANAFSGSQIEKVVFEEGTADLVIGDYAFYQSYIKDMKLPARTRSIGAYALAGMSRLQTLDLGGVQTIGAYALAQIPSAVGTIKVPSTVLTIGEHAFDYIGANVEFAVNSKVTKIGAYAFYNASITSITIPGSVTSIGTGAFYNCRSLKAVTFEESNNDLVLEGDSEAYERGTFYYAPLESLELPARLTAIGEWAFYSCKAKEITFAEGSRLTTIGGNAFTFTEIKSIKIPASVRNTTDAIGIGTKAFYGCSYLTSVIFENDPTGAPLTIGESAFASAYRIEEITLPSRLASFTAADGTVIPPLANGTGVFESCSALKAVKIEGTAKGELAAKDGIVYTADYTEVVFCPSMKEGKVVLPKTLVKVGEKAFFGCRNITSITFEDGSVCTEIESGAFSGCSKITELILPPQLKTIANDALTSCGSLTRLVLSASMTDFDPELIKDCNSLTALEVDPNNPSIKGIDGVLFTKDGTELVFYAPTREETEYAVPEGVTVIASRAFANNKNLKKVILPKSLMVLESYTFDSCSSLTTVEFAKGGTEALVLGSNLFYSAGITSIEIPARTSVIDARAFYSATSLKNITFEEGCALTEIGKETFYRTAITEIVLPDSITRIGANAFEWCQNLVSIKLPDSLTTLGDEVFTSCSSLESITLPASLVRFEEGRYGYEGIFNGCSNLKRVIFEEGCMMEYIPNATFEDCDALEYVVLPTGLREISDPEEYGDGLFQEKENLKEVVFPEGCAISRIGNNAFNNSSLEIIDIPNTVTYLGNNCFYGTKLVSVTVPESVTNLGYYTFYNCKSLESIDFRAQVQELPRNFVANCSSLTEFNIPASVKTIADGAFGGCSSLAKITVDVENTVFSSDEQGTALYTKNATGRTLMMIMSSLTEYVIPADVTEITSGVFNGSNVTAITFEEGGEAELVLGEANLEDYYDPYGVFTGAYIESIALPPRVKAIPAYAFYNAESLTTVSLPATIETVGEGIFSGASSLSTVNVAEGCEVLRTDANGIFYMKNATGWDLILVPGKEGFTEFEVPADVTLIASGAFASSNVTKVTFASGRTSELVLAEMAFAGSQITDVVLPDGLKEIPNELFNEYYSSSESPLQTIVIPDSVTSIGHGAFYRCTSLRTINIPSGVIEIGQGAFYYCSSLTTIVIPDGVTDIVRDTFQNCSNLETVQFGAGIKTVSSGAFRYCNKLKAFTVSESNTAFCAKFGILFDKNWNFVLVPTGLEDVVIPKEVTFIPKGTFYGMSIKTLTFETGRSDALIIQDATGGYNNYGAFQNCTSLTTVTLPDGLVKIADYAFYGCSSLETVTFGKDITTIGKQAFEGCTKLSTIVLPEETTLTMKNGMLFDSNWNFVFVPSALENVVIPKEVTLIPKGTFYNKGMKTLTFEDGRTAPLVIEDKGSDWSEHGAFQNCYSLTSVVLPEGLVKLGSYAFNGCSNLTSVTLPSTLKEIGESAFASSGITEIVLPEGLEVIPNNCFNYCTSLASIVIPASVTTIGEYAFSSCYALKEIYIPTTVTTMGYSALSYWREDQTINVAYAEADLPETWNSDWLGWYPSAKVVYGAEAPEEDKNA